MEIIREIEGEPIKHSKDVEKWLTEFQNQDREHFIVIGLNTKNEPVYREIVSIGTLNTTLVHPREVFKKAIIMSCNSIIIAHNHPSGDIIPSKEDIEVHKKLIESSKILDIKILDCFIIGKTIESFIDSINSIF